MFKGVGFALLILSKKKLLSHENEIVWSHWIFKTGGGGGFK